MSEPLISVIVPVYNNEEQLGRAVESVLAQTHRNLEIILVDDGSTDGSGAICDRFARRDSRVKVVHQDNKGVSAARNVGLDTASGEWIGFVDGDDWVKPEMYVELLNAAIYSSKRISVCGFIKHHPDGWSEIYDCKNLPTLVERYESLECLLSQYYFEGFVCNKLYNRRSLSCEGSVWFDEGMSFCEDLLFNFKLMMHTDGLACVHRSMYHYCIYETGASKSFNQKRLGEIAARKQTVELADTVSVQLGKLARAYYANAMIGLLYSAVQCGDVGNVSQIKKESGKYVCNFVSSGDIRFKMKLRGLVIICCPYLAAAVWRWVRRWFKFSWWR